EPLAILMIPLKIQFVTYTKKRVLRCVIDYKSCYVLENKNKKYILQAFIYYKQRISMF
ncbi:unnamed protein product, partial [marine sediment metagenome]